MRIWFVIFFIVVSTLKANATNQESLTKWKEFGDKLKDFDTSNPMHIIQSVLGFGDLIPEVAPFTSVLSGLLGLFGNDNNDDEIKQDLEQLQEHLNEIDTHLMTIEYKIDQLSDTINVNTIDTTIKQSYKNHAEKIMTLYGFFQLYKRDLKDPVLREDFINECKNGEAFKFALYISDELNEQTILKLDDMITRDNNIYSLGAWSKILSIDLSKAFFLNGVCYGARKASRQSNSAVFDAEDSYYETFKETFDSLSKYVEKARSSIYSNYQSTAMTAAQNYAINNQGSAHDTFVDGLDTLLHQLFPWRYFILLSIDEDVYDADVGGHVLYWWKFAGRGLFVASMDHFESDFGGRLQDCVNQKQDYWAKSPESSAADMYSDLSKCISFRDCVIYRCYGGDALRGYADYHAHTYSDWHIFMTPNDNGYTPYALSTNSFLNETKPPSRKRIYQKPSKSSNTTKIFEA